MSTVLASLSRHTLQQFKFILPGGIIAFYLNPHNKFWHIYNEEGGAAGTLALVALVSAFVTFMLFMYVILYPLVTGELPDYRHWRQSGLLSTVIPILTTSILLGWTTLSLVLGRWSDLGYIEGLVAASGLYALGFGLLGLIPAPRVHRK